MTIETILFTIDINPLLMFLAISAIVVGYAIKRGYDHSSAAMHIKAQQGQRIY